MSSSNFGKGEMHEVIPWFMRGYPGAVSYPTLIVAEIGNNHEGSLGNVIRMIQASARCGVDAIKIQHHIPWEESTEKEQWPERFNYHPQDATRFQYWERMHFTPRALDEIQKACYKHQVKLIASPFSVASFKWLEKYCNCWGYKIASGEVNHVELLDVLQKTDKQIIISTGMSDTREVNTCVMHVMKDAKQDNIYVLQCTTEYPTPFTKIGMNVAECYSRNLLFKGGLSDHSGTIFPSIIASYLGAHMVEVHVCFSKEQFGADIKASLTFEQLRQLVDGVRVATVMRANPINKDLYKPDIDTQVYREGKKR